MSLSLIIVIIVFYIGVIGCYWVNRRAHRNDPIPTISAILTSYS